MSNLKYKHTAYTSAQWASLNPVIVENEIVIESDTKRTKIGNGISTYNELEYADANSVGNSLGSIKPTDAAPTPARNGNYTFSIGGAKPAWLTSEAGITTVKAGDGVAVVYAAPSGYTYTHIDTGYSIEQVRSQSTSKVPSSKLVDDELNNKADLVVGKNKFDKSTITAGYYIVNTTGALVSSSNWSVSDFIPVIPAQNYIMSFASTLGNNFSCFFDVNKNVVQGGIHNSLTKEFTPPANAVYFRIAVSNDKINSLQIEIGTVATAYEAYYKSVIASIGAIEGLQTELTNLAPINYVNPLLTTKSITGKAVADWGANKADLVVGKNKFDKSTITAGYYIVNTTGALVSSGDWSVSDFIPVIPAQNYIMSFASTARTNFSCFFDVNKNVVQGGISNSLTKEFTPPANAVYFRIAVSNDKINSLQIEIGTVATAYEAYYKSVIASIGAIEGLQQILDETIYSRNFMFGKEFFTICDSLGASGVWQAKLASLTGGIFDNSKNTSGIIPLSVGGTATIGRDKTCGQWRARNLVENYPTAKVVFIENINDLNYNTGTITDVPFMLERIDDYASQGFTSKLEADNFFTNNFASIVSQYVPIKGAVINVPYSTTSSKNLKIVNLPTSNGNISLVVNGLTYSIAILTSDTIANIISKILNYEYVGVVDSANVDGLSVDFSAYGGVALSFDAQGTGMTVTIIDSISIRATSRYFIGDANSTDWNNSAKWTETIPTTYSAMRGLIEYLQKNLPTADIIWFIPPRYGISASSFLRSDGTPDIDAFTTADADYQSLCDKQIAVCNLYNIQYVDLNKKGGISLFNVFTYYNENNVHPKQAGYEKWAEMIYKLLIG